MENNFIHSFKKNITLISTTTVIAVLSVYYFAYLNVPLVYSVAPKQVYYSVGQNTNDHKTGNPTVAISNGTATFSVAQTAINLGVGDRVTYRGNNQVFISGKVSPTQWTVVTKTGDTPSNVTSATVNSIRHEFSSLWNAISLYSNTPPGVFDNNHLGTTNLVNGNFILNIPLYYDTGPDVIGGDVFQDEVLIDNITTGPGNFVRIYTPDNTSSEVNQSQRHSGIWNSQKYNIQFNPDDNSASAIRVYIPYVKIDGLQIKINSAVNGNSGLEASYIDFGWVEMSNNIITGQISNYAYGIGAGFNTSSTTLRIWNNLIYDLKGSAYGSSAGVVFNNNNGISYIYSNTLVNNPIGINNQTGTIVAKNNIIQDTDPNIYGIPNPGFKGSFAPSSDYNITDNGNAPGSHSKKATVIFVNKAAKNFHLASSDTAAKDAGICLDSDPNLTLSTDFDSQNRPGGPACDIGSDEQDIPTLFSASLTSTNGVNGSSLLNTSLKADATYSGPVTDRVNYTFWWNCNDPSSNVTYLKQALVCGDPTNPAYGAKYDNQPGGTANTSLTSSNHAYSLGAYTAKVVIERGSASAVERRLPINVTNSRPNVSNVTITEANYCTSGPATFVSWTFSDSPGDTQSAYQVQIDDQSSFNSPEVDSGKVLSNSTFFSGQGLLQFNTTYQARVQVWDNSDVSSPWVKQTICVGPGCEGGGTSWKTPKHAHPLYAPFTWTPTYPLANQSVQFFNQSICYNDNNLATACDKWNYDFDYPSGTDSSNDPNPTHVYSNFGTYRVSETVEDNNDYICPNPFQEQLINVRRQVPSWREASARCGDAVAAAFSLSNFSFANVISTCLPSF